MSSQSNTRWDLVRKVCVAGLVVSLWILIVFGLGVWIVGGTYFPDPSTNMIAVTFGVLLLQFLTMFLFGKIFMASPNVPFWFVPAAGVLSLTYFWHGAYSRYLPTLLVSAALAFITFEMRKDLRRAT